MGGLAERRLGHTSPSRCVVCDSVLDLRGVEGGFYVYRCRFGHTLYSPSPLKYEGKELLEWLEWKCEELEEVFRRGVNDILRFASNGGGGGR